MTLLSSTVSAGQQALATQYNNIRKDVLLKAGDYTVATGSTNAYVLAIDAQFTAYATGDTFVFKANFTNTATCTLNVNSAGAKTLKNTDGDTLWNGAIQNNSIVECTYDGTDLIVKSELNYMNYYYFGNGTDGNVTISVNTTLTRDMHYNDLVVSADLDPAGYAIYVRGTISGAGKILRNGNNGTAGSGGGSGAPGAGGAGGTALASGTCGPNAGGVTGGAGSLSGAGTAGTVGTSYNPSYATTSTTGASGGAGGNGGASGGAGGGGGTATQGVFANTVLSVAQILSIQMYPGRAFYSSQVYNGTPGSGSGGGGSGTGGTSGAGGGGGAGGNGGTIFIAARIWSGTGTIESKGGTGGNGGAAFATGTDAGGGGGGGGGNGGVVIIVYKTGTPWTQTLTGGNGGTGGAGRLTGGNGTAGSTGTVGQSILITV